MRNRVIDAPEVINQLVLKCPAYSEAIRTFVTAVYQISSNLDAVLEGAKYQKMKTPFPRLYRRHRMYRLGDGQCCISFTWKHGLVADLDVIC